jgi:two-component system sensor kinase FixL
MFADDENTTHREQARTAANESRQPFQMLLERSPDAMLLVDDDAHCLDVNQAACQMLGCCREQLLGKRTWEFGFKKFKPEPLGKPDGNVSQNPDCADQCSFMRPDGQLWACDCSTYRVSPHFHLCILRDVTERHRLEREILEISDAVQWRLSQDLHDGLGQHLAGVGYMSEALASRLSSRSAPEAGQAAQIADLIAQAGVQARDIARSLYPVELDANSLPDALHLVAVNANKIHGMHCALELEGGAPQLPNLSVMHLYRIAQEAVYNARRYGQANQVVIRLDCAPERIALTVRDNGEEPSPDAAARQRLGLHMMARRAAMLDGSLTVNPGAQGGIVVTCTVPAHPASTA